MPEDATSYRGIYLDCSSFANSVYYNLFGQDVVPTDNYNGRVDTYIMSYYARTEWAKGDAKASDVIYYVDTSDYTTDSARAAILKEIEENLQPGDLIVYRHGASSASAGHVMLYVGNGTILHSTGSSFAINETNPMKAKDNATADEASIGSVQTLSLSTVLTKSSSTRYLFNDGSSSSSAKVWNFAVLRPLNKFTELSSDGVNRSKTLGLSIEKTSVAPHMSSVVAGDEITYTITITNKGTTTLKNILVSDTISNLVTIVNNSITNNGVLNSNTITWNISELKKGATINLTYKVKVNNTASVGSVIESYDALVNGVRTNKIYHVITKNINYDTLKSNILALTSNPNYSDFREAVYTVYNGIIDKDTLSSYLPSKTLLYTLLHLDSGYKLNKDHASLPILMPDFYGGLWLQFQDSNQVRLVKNDYLDTGDIILTRYNDSSDNKIYTAYLYVDSNTIIQIDSNGNVSNIITSNYSSDLFLTQLIGYKLYAILRPSLIQ